ncbi:MAG TPA: hypothetical protein VFV71_09185 [Burkholderiales bacterium]|nr:hypothetical protein [Burkholderiales bacterium]
MNEVVSPDGNPSDSSRGIAQVIYALHTLSILIGLTSAITIVGAFVFGLPSIFAVILNYIYQASTRGSYVESHFRWQIRTFWFAALWIMVGWVVLISLALVLIGIPLAWMIWVGTGLWVIYRVARGWLALQDRKPMTT